MISRVPRIVLLACVVATLVATGACWGLLDGIPHVTDEIAYTWQARLFAHGQWTGPAAPEPSLLQVPFWNASPRGHGVFPVGWPALLALGEVVKAGWLVNPLLFGGVPLLTWALAREAVDEPVAQLAAGIAALSPGAWLLAASRMSQTSVLVALLFLAAVVARRRDGAGAWVLAGVAAGYVVLARPFDAALLALPLLLVGMARAPVGGQKLLLLVGPALATAAVLWVNRDLTGSPLTFAVSPWFDQWVVDFGRPAGCNRMGFGDDVGCMQTLGSWGHTPDKALTHTLDNLKRLDRLLFGLPGGSVLVVAGMVLLKQRAVPLAIAVGVVVGGYAMYWSPGMAYGARFYHPLYAVLPLAAAVAMHRVAGNWAWVAVLLLPIPGSIQIASELRAEGYWCVDAGLKRQLRELGVTQGVVMMQGVKTRDVSWPSVGVAAFRCDAMLEAGDGFALQSPDAWQGDLQFRHALPDAAITREYLNALQPGAVGYVAIHDVPQDTWRLLQVAPDSLIPVAEWETP